MTDVSVTISEEPVAVSIGSGTGPAGAAGSSGVITVSAPLTNSGTSSAAILGLSVGSGLSIVGGALTAVAGSYTLPVASASVLGGVKQGSNVTIDGTGILSVAAPVTWSTISGRPTFATVATSGAYADLSGTPAAYSLPTATSGVLGGIKIGSGLTIDGSGVVTAAGTYTLPAATGSTLGGVIVGSGLAVTSGTISLGSHASTHQTGGADAVASVVVTPSSLTADVNNWSIGTGDVFRVAGTAARNITGIAAGTSGLTILVVNVGSFALTLKHQSASSTAANRFTTPWAGDCILAAAGGNAVLIYDSTTATWRVL